MGKEHCFLTVHEVTPVKEPDPVSDVRDMGFEIFG